MAHWKPHPGPQEKALMRPEFEVLYGGARGGGKTDAGIVTMTDYVYHPEYRGLVIRRNADDLSDWFDRATRMYAGFGAKGVGGRLFRFPNGAKIRTGHLKDDQAYTKYQGHEYQKVLIEELTQIPDEKRYLQLISSCRSTIPELRPQIFSTTNPGGVGHGWVKSRFVDHLPWGQPFSVKGDRPRIFIPAKVDDNPTLVDNDPEYVKFLDSLKDVDEQLYKAWRLGSWDVFSGQVFREFSRQRHVTLELDFKLSDCKKVIGFDWGYRAPAAVIWLAIAPPNRFGVSRVFVYRELYITGKEPEELAKLINIFTSKEKTEYMVLPHDCYSRPRGGSSISEVFDKEIKTRMVQGNTMGKGARLNRVAITHKMLSEAEDGKPRMQFLPKVENTLRTLPELIYDESNVEDVDTTGEDHAYDALSMALLFVRDKYKLLSGAVKKPYRPQLRTERTFRQNEKGEMLSPNFNKAFKNRLNKRSKGQIENINV